MITVTRRSWHFRIYSWLAKYFLSMQRNPTNLCEYMKSWIWALFCGGILLVICGMTIFCVVAMIKAMHWFVLLVPAGIGLVFLIAWLALRFSNTEVASLIGEYIKAKKERFCPKMTIVD